MNISGFLPENHKVLVARTDGWFDDRRAYEQTMLAESDSGVNTYSLSRGSAYGAHTVKRDRTVGSSFFMF